MDVVTYALLKKKITSALTGIADISLDGNQTIVFETNDGTQFKIKIPTPDLIYIGSTPPPVDSDYELWIDTDEEGTSGTGKAILSQDLVASTAIGSVKVGKVYNAGTPLEDIIRDILTSYTKPTVTISTAPTTDLYDVVVDTLSTINITSKVTKGTENITSVSFYVDEVELETKTGEDVAAGGTFTVTKNFNPATNKTFVCKVSANDGKNVVNTTKTIVFIGKSYYGTVGESVTVPTEADIKGLQNNVLKNSRALTYQNIAVDYGKVLYAYPKSLGLLTKIVDKDNRDYSESYTHGEVKVDNIDYYYYILTDAMGTDDGYQKFS